MYKSPAGFSLYPLPPCGVGLSHMDQSIEKEGFAPSGMEHLVAHALRPGRCLQDVDCELAQDGEVLGGMIFAGAAGVCGEQDIEDPMEIVLDAPMGAHCLEELLGGEAAGDQEQANLGLLRRGAADAAPALDAPDGHGVGKAMLSGEFLCGDDKGLAALGSAMGAGRALGCPRGPGGGGDESLGRLKEGAPVVLEGQD